MTDPFFSIDISQESLTGLDQMILAAGATDGQFERARTRALRKLNKVVERAIKQQAAARLRIPQKALDDRFFSRRIEDGAESLRVWIGAWALSPFSVGQPRQQLKGVRVGRRYYPGAWLGSVYTLEEKVWIRLRSPHFSSELYPTRYRAGDRGLASDHRFPVVRAAVSIDAVIGAVLQRNGQEYADRFLTIFGQELNYEITVRGSA